MKILERIRGGEVLVSDGAWGTFLQKMGLKPGECPEWWNVEHPEKVMEIASSYIAAGADMVETNSFGGNRFKLAHFGLADKVYEINKKAAEISRQAAGINRYVLGSVGPTGKMILTGDVTFDELYDAFKEQVVALADGGADAIVVETMTDIEEATAAVKAAKENTDCLVICTMTFDKTGENEFHTMMGVTPADMLGPLIDAGADMIGANCGNGMENMIVLARLIREANNEIPLLVHANAGAPVFQNGETVFLETPTQMASYVKQLIETGVNIIGGCCGTTPEHIREIYNVVHKK